MQSLGSGVPGVFLSQETENARRWKTERGRWEETSVLGGHCTAVNVRKPLNTRKSMTAVELLLCFPVSVNPGLCKYRGIFTLRWWAGSQIIRSEAPGPWDTAQIWEAIKSYTFIQMESLAFLRWDCDGHFVQLRGWSRTRCRFWCFLRYSLENVKQTMENQQFFSFLNFHNLSTSVCDIKNKCTEVLWWVWLYTNTYNRHLHNI